MSQFGGTTSHHLVMPHVIIRQYRVSRYDDATCHSGGAVYRLMVVPHVNICGATCRNLVVPLATKM